ncbi:Cytochrome P450 [Corchorus olitorius]|uniref:Cytochrome P450 n=1 Tax=Corchorus olitorius TaxID=93759 RepID=A0A1R3J5K8_9ROSI|nr:Cytochrome P450 [Corchorus olitorius]
MGFLSTEVIIFLFPFLLTLFLLLKKSNKEVNQVPPSPPRLPILGNLLQFGSLTHRSLWQLSRKYGPVMLLHLGRIPVLIVSSAEAAREILKVNDISCCSRLQKASTAKIYSFTGSVAFKTAFGTCFRGSKFDSDKFYELVDQTQIVLGRISAEEFFPGVGWIWDRINGHNQRLERVFHALDTFYEEVIDDHLKPGRTSTKQHDDIVDVMLGIIKEQTEDGHAWLTKNHIKAVLLVIMNIVVF